MPSDGDKHARLRLLQEARCRELGHGVRVPPRGPVGMTWSPRGPVGMTRHQALHRGPAQYPELTSVPCASRGQTPLEWSLNSVGEDVGSKMHSMLPSRLFDSPGSGERPRVAAAGRIRYPLKALSQFSEEETEGYWLTQSQFSKDTGEEDATSWKLRVRRRAFSASWGRAREEHCRNTKFEALRRAGGGKAPTRPCQACESIIDEASLVCEVPDAHSVLLCPSHWLSIADTLQRTNTAALVSR